MGIDWVWDQYYAALRNTVFMPGNSFNAQNGDKWDIQQLMIIKIYVSFKHYLVMVNILEIYIHKIMIILVLWRI